MRLDDALQRVEAVGFDNLGRVDAIADRVYQRFPKQRVIVSDNKCARNGQCFLRIAVLAVLDQVFDNRRIGQRRRTPRLPQSSSAIFEYRRPVRAPILVLRPGRGIRPSSMDWPHSTIG
jgi:hypothetical protein